MFKAGDDHNDRYYCSCGSVQSLWIQRNTTSKHLKLGRHWVSSPISAIKAMNILSAFDSNKEKNAIELNGFYDYVLYTHRNNWVEAVYVFDVGPHHLRVHYNRSMLQRVGYRLG